jgi:xylulokinase
MLPTTGRLFEWFRNITGQQDRDYAAMLEEIVGLGSEDFAGGYFFPNIQAEGGLSLSSAFISTAGLTSRPELGKSVLEAIGFMVRGAIDKLERHGYRIEGMRLSGGQAKNPRWNQLKADISGRCLSVPTIPDGELAGDASMAMLALGEVRDLGEAIENTVRLGEVYEPDQRAYAVYSERYDAYRALQNKMEKFLG